MKKLLSLMMVTMLAMTAWAENVFYTLDGTQSEGANTPPYNAYAEASPVTQNEMSWQVYANTNMSPWRIGGKKSTTGDGAGIDREVYSTTPMGNPISKVSLQVGEAKDITVNSLKLIVASDANFTNKVDEVTATFVASSTINFTPTSGAEWATGLYYKFIFNVAVNVTQNKFVQFMGATFYTESGEATIAAPRFNPAGGTYYVAQNVEISATEGATIYYTIDGSDPTTSSTVYSEPINVASTTTIKAIATKDDLVSSVASATYTIEQITTVNNIAEYVALGTGAYAAIANPVTVYFVKGQNVWVMDESGRMCIYGKVVGNMNYKSGDVIPGGFGGYLKEYNGGPEMTFEGDQNLFGFQEATIHGDAIAPEVVTTANVSTDIWGHYVEIKKATVSDVNNKNFNINDAAGTLAGYNGMSVTLPTDLEIEYNITGIVASHNNNVRLLPSNFEKIINIDDLSTVDNIAALLATAEGTDVKISNPVTVVYQNGESLYIQDESAWTLVFGQLDNTYNNGDILTGIAGSWKTFYEIIEMVPLAESFGEATPGTAVEPEVLAIEELSTNLVHKFIKIDNCAMTKVDDVTYNLNDETEDLTMYMKFDGVTAPEDLTATYNVSGFLTLYKPKDAETAIMEFYPVEFEKVGGEPQPVPGDVNGDGEVTGSDVTALYNHILFGQDTEIFNGDQNGDGEVTGSDVTAVYNIILGL